ncbi:hypothetical protein WJ96_04520 [Burkholderia ubonensis]|uniref:Polymer-forming cytoskeletal protein n=1 Tax=Burkholderia ubonensis TaxID=101571 RepID=A0AAW3MVN4_9BURK|nr:hypothetical protein [Burkholderia ubonensis]KVP65637.1 hypothetical protein WJ93_24255 [Burkholderia ubonensis]KVP96495.1 hypothetical protein WJ97_11435 [Burkholderia ubonensis]KVP97840.1 hypothetical protein WJ96_04520 [Burkholderia ubonensis]KVZ92537.1 hypothetical protein WL25_16175 [Burkholderia ubonensis]
MSISIIINGKRLLGGNLRIQHGDVYIDGNRVELGKVPKIDIVVQGNLETMEVGAASSIEVQGSVGKLKTGSGGVKCGEVRGDVSTGSGDVECGDVQGSVTTASGDVDCRNVGGNIKTVSGDVTTRRA